MLFPSVKWSSEILTTEKCLGRGMAAVERGVPSERTWTGVCPICRGRFELLYAGLLPDHVPDADSESEIPD